jgi:hypothetical protein
MQQSLKRFQALIPGAQAELIECRALLRRLNSAQRRAAANKLSEKALLSFYKSLPDKFRLRLRGGVPADDSLPQTREFVEELNQMIILIEKKKKRTRNPED